MGLDHEKLDVYQLELRFVAWATVLIDEVQGSRGPKVGEVCNHLDRASLSSLFNTAEGNGKRRRQIRGKFFDDARGSATECAACLDALVAKGACVVERVADGKAMLVRVVSMLTKLVARFSATDEIREELGQYDTAGPSDTGIEDEDEKEDEDDS
jgi:four helix bundle protein